MSDLYEYEGNSGHRKQPMFISHLGRVFASLYFFTMATATFNWLKESMQRMRLIRRKYFYGESY